MKYPAHRGAYLLVLQRGSSAVVHCPSSGTLRIGRGASASVQVADGDVADEHAELRVDGTEVTLVALGGGTWVNQERVAGSRVLTSGDVITVGEAALVFHRAPSRPPPRPILDLPELRRRLAEETERALRYGRPLAVVAVDLGAPASAIDGAVLAAAVGQSLRLVDVLAWDGGAELYAVLPETAESASVPGARLVRALSELAPDARAGFSMCPDDGCDVDTLLTGARNAAQCADASSVVRAAEAASTLTIGERTIAVADPMMKKLWSLVERLAASDLPVLVSGETGAGKEIVAHALHEWSPRRSAKMVAVNCAALPATLLESELFGHERGAFSGATTAKPGLFESADGGTVLLDEIGESTPEAQAKLLRVLETKRVTRIGGLSERSADVRIVAATNRDLAEDTLAGRFRQDLLFRLSAATVVVPPLRHRTLDVPVLARRFLAEACARLGRPALSLSPAAMQRLALHEWPGNVRELKNLMDYAAATIDGGALDAEHLADRLTSQPPWMTARARPAPAPRRFRNIYDEIRELERTRMLEALEEAGGVRMKAAAMIGMPLRTFVTKMKEHGLQIPPARRGK